MRPRERIARAGMAKDLEAAQHNELRLLLKISRLKDRIRELEGGVHLNPESVLPPVDTPLLVLIPDGRLVNAVRPTFLASRNDQITYRFEDGSEFVGRLRWTYP